MPAKPSFNAEQKRLLREALLRLRARYTQEQLEPLLGIKQQSIGPIEKGRNGPSYQTAENIAKLEGKTLAELFGERSEQKLPPGFVVVTPKTLPGLERCLGYYDDGHWSPWTVAAARAGMFGNIDFKPAEWTAKLDILEKALERLRKVA